LAAPFPLTQGLHARVEVAQRTDDQEHVHVGCSVVHGCGNVGDAQGGIASAAGVDVDLVVSRAWMESSDHWDTFIEECEESLPQCARKVTELGSALTTSSSIKPVMVTESKVLYAATAPSSLPDRHSCRNSARFVAVGVTSSAISDSDCHVLCALDGRKGWVRRVIHRQGERLVRTGRWIQEEGPWVWYRWNPL
jgi:hypothetical protein